MKMIMFLMIVLLLLLGCRAKVEVVSAPTEQVTHTNQYVETVITDWDKPQTETYVTHNLPTNILAPRFKSPFAVTNAATGKLPDNFKILCDNSGNYTVQLPDGRIMANIGGKDFTVHSEEQARQFAWYIIQVWTWPPTITRPEDYPVIEWKECESK